jgi:hypothetical protein
MFILMEQLYGIWGGGKGKENDRERFHMNMLDGILWLGRC